MVVVLVVRSRVWYSSDLVTGEKAWFADGRSFVVDIPGLEGEWVWLSYPELSRLYILNWVECRVWILLRFARSWLRGVQLSCFALDLI